MTGRGEPRDTWRGSYCSEHLAFTHRTQAAIERELAFLRGLGRKEASLVVVACPLGRGQHVVWPDQARRWAAGAGQEDRP